MMKKTGKLVIAGAAALAAVGAAAAVKKLKEKQEKDITEDFQGEPEMDFGDVEYPAPETPADKARNDRMQKVKDLDNDPFCKLFDELCK